MTMTTINNHHKKWTISTTGNNINSNNYVRLKISLSVIAITVLFCLYSSATNVRYTFDTYNNNNSHKTIIYHDNNNNTNNDESISSSSSTTTTTTTSRYLDRNKTNDTKDDMTKTVVPKQVTQQAEIFTSAPTSAPTNSPSTAPPSNAPTHAPTNSTASNVKSVMTPNNNNINNHTNNIPNNLHLVFIGDSLTRYQYIALVYYLHTGTWLEKDQKPNILREKDFADWSDFYGYSNRIFDGKEKCDCYRNSVVQFEQRYYSDPYRNNYITYILKYGYRVVQGHWHPQDAYQNITSIHYNYNYNNKGIGNNSESSLLWQRYFESTDLIKPIWKYDWVDLIQHHVALLQPRPQYLIMNAGLWANDLDKQTYLERIQHVCRLNNITTIYKTTTSRRREGNSNYFVNYPHEIIACQVFDVCLNMSWTRNVPRTDDFFWDHLHVQPNMNRYFNEQLFLVLNQNDYHNFSINEWISDVAV